MQQELVKYDAACRAVAEAKTIDEVLEINNRAEALRAYARQAKNRQIEIDAIEIRVRAERKLGELLLAIKRNGGLKSGQNHLQKRVTMNDIGVDGTLSATAQRLALLPSGHFDGAISEWRQSAENSPRLEMPLQRYRKPNVGADRQRVAARRRTNIEAKDGFDQYRGSDGRRIVDWRIGELTRIISVAERTIAVASALAAECPQVDDTLQTVEMVFTREKLEALFEHTWTPARRGPSALEAISSEESQERRRRVCQHCGVSFIAHRPGGLQRRHGRWGIYCSRTCVGAAQRKKN